MRRWLAIFLLVLLPTQATWAVVAGYCVDSPGVTAGHFGHHDRSLHGHTLTPPEASPEDALGSGSNNMVSTSPDCGHCHGHFAGVLTEACLLQLESSHGPSFLAQSHGRTARLPDLSAPNGPSSPDRRVGAPSFPNPVCIEAPACAGTSVRDSVTWPQPADLPCLPTKHWSIGCIRNHEY